VLLRATVVRQIDEFFVCSAEAIDAEGNIVALGHETAVLTERRSRGASPESQSERVLATVLFTDIVGSTELAAKMGDAGWSALLADHHDVVRRHIKAFKGREVKTTGDGFLATFETPARAVHCARAIRDGVRGLGLEVRAGLHTGECELLSGDLAGIAVHAAARIVHAAKPGEILVSGTVRDIAAGSGLRFVERGRQPLKGLEGEWQLFGAEG
jgi:class 3 adenylate cyclase